MFRRKASAGISVTEECLKFSLVNRQKRGISVEHRTEKLPDDVIKGGKIIDESLFLTAIKKLVHNTRKNMRIHLSLPSALIMVRFMNFPNVPEKSLRKLINFEVMNNMFFPFSDPYFDHIIQPIEHTANADQNERQVMLVAASESVLHQYVALFEKAQLKVASIELDAFALHRLLLHFGQDMTKSTVMTINIMNEQTDISVVKDGYVKITRTIPLNISIQSNTSYNHEYSQLVGEIERIISFYTYSMNNRNEQIMKIYVFGDIDHLNDVVTFIRNHVQTEVLIIDKKNKLQTKEARKVDLEPVLTHAVSMGLSLKGAK